jgi:hypothetical protein
MFWLAYRCENDPCVIVIDAKSIVLARLLAAMVADGIDTHFIEGGELSTDVASSIPTSAVGRLLTAKEAERVLDGLVAKPPTRRE